MLPRILTMPEIKEIAADITCEIETIILGNHGLMLEGRCSLYQLGARALHNMDGVFKGFGMAKPAISSP